MTLKPKTNVTAPRNPRALLTVKEVAAFDACSEKTVRRAIEARLLDVVRIGPGGRMIRIEPSAHLAYRRAYRE